VRREGAEDFGGFDGQPGAPAVRDNAALGGVQSNDEMFPADGCRNTLQAAKIRSTVFEGGAADDDLRHAKFHKRFCARDRTNASADADLHAEFAASFDGELMNEAIVVALAHGRVEVDDVEPLINGEALQQAHDIGNRKFAAAAVDQLDGATSLEINAGNQHPSLTLTPLECRNLFNSAMDWTLS